MLERLLDRGRSSGRTDDNIESIKKRFNTYQNETRPVLDYYSSKHKLAYVDAKRSKEEVYKDVRRHVDTWKTTGVHYFPSNT